jgi:putative ABC transport system permease protein
MLKNFFKTAVRNIARNKAYSIINFIGLTSGLALCLLIIVYVRSEVGYDKFHANADRLYRINYFAPNGMLLASSPPPLAVHLPEYFPEIEMTGRIFRRNVSIKKLDADEAFEEGGIAFADSTIMKMMTFEFVKGHPERPLEDKFTVILTEQMATKYFGDKDPIGESLLFGGKHTFTVIGVIKDFTERSHIDFNMIVPFENMFDMESDQTAQVLRANLDINFIISHSYNYVLLKPGADPTKINEGMAEFIKKYAQPRLQVGQIFTLIPVEDIHLKSEAVAEPTATNTYSNLLLFVGVGLLTLVIACINYINLSTAQSFTRVKEIGIRKILGSMRYQIIAQFLAESFLFCLVALVLSFAVFYFALPVLNQLTNKNILFASSIDIALVGMGIGLMVFITLMAGGYPSWFVARFNSVSTLNGAGTTGAGGQLLRKTLIVFQLGIACMLLSSSMLIIKQLDYLESRPLGFRKDHVINVPVFSQNLNGIFGRPDSTFRIRLQSFRDEVEAQTGIQSTALSSNPPGLGVVFHGLIPEGFTQEDNMFIANLSVDYDFFDTYDIEMVAGRAFSKDYGTDLAEGFIVNETAVREFKWETPEKAIGKTLNREGKIGKVVGVMKDINFTSLRSPVSAMVMEMNQNRWTSLSIRFDNVNITETITTLEQKWNAMFPEKSFQYTFLEEQLNQQYANERNFGTIIQSFTGIAILISCLGVYGLVLFVVQRKVKEIGVRKVLGASVSNILTLICKDFALLVIIGFALAIPGSWYLMDQWLSEFSYRTSVDMWTYALSLILVVGVTAITVSHQAYRASVANPVKSLRTE